MHGKAVIQHIPWRDRLPVRISSQLAFRTSDSTLALWLTQGFSLLGENVLLAESCQLPIDSQATLPRPCGLEWNETTRQGLFYAHACWIPAFCHSNAIWQILITFSAIVLTVCIFYEILWYVYWQWPQLYRNYKTSSAFLMGHYPQGIDSNASSPKDTRTQRH